MVASSQIRDNDVIGRVCEQVGRLLLTGGCDAGAMFLIERERERKNVQNYIFLGGGEFIEGRKM